MCDMLMYLHLFILQPPAGLYLFKYFGLLVNNQEADTC